MRTPAPLTLEGRTVRLEPLAPSHATDLADAASLDPDGFAYMPASPLTAEAQASAIAEALELAESGAQVPFALIDLASGRAIGSTRYLDISVPDERIEIGWTWIAAPYRGGIANPEMKLLLLGHAFDELGANRVALKTDARNFRSQQAIAKLGATREGVLRQHMVMPDGHRRDTVYYSILAFEWPAARDRLTQRVRGLAAE